VPLNSLTNARLGGGECIPALRPADCGGKGIPMGWTACVEVKWVSGGKNKRLLYIANHMLFELQVCAYGINNC